MNQQRSLVISFFIVIAALVTLGFIFIYASSSAFALEKLGSAHFFVKKQFFGLVLGFFCLVVLRMLPLEIIKKYSPLLFIATLGATIATLTPWFGVTIHGSHRWLRLPGGVTFQPSEFLKLAFVLYIAYLLDKKKYSTFSLLHTYIPLLCVIGVTSIILLKQPDFGITVTLCITAFFLFFIAELPLSYLAWTIASALPAMALLIYIAPYRIKRLATFLNPWDDPLGAGFQIIQSLIAIGSGGCVGVGMGQSKQKFFYLPMQHTDFIFSILAEETGFLGTCIFLIISVLFLYLGIRLALMCTSSFAYYTVSGLIALITLQTLINIAVATGLVPTKGIGLPFVSYGISALVSNLCMVGVILNCATTAKK